MDLGTLIILFLMEILLRSAWIENINLEKK